MRYPWGSECVVPNEQLINYTINRKRPRLLPGDLAGQVVWVIGKGYQGDAQLFARRLKLSLPRCFLVAADGVDVAMPDARSMVPGQSTPPDDTLIIADGGCSLEGIAPAMVKCWGTHDPSISYHHRFSVIPLCTALTVAGAAKIRLAGCVPGFRTTKQRVGGKYFGNFWVPPEGLSDLAEFNKMKAWAKSQGSEVSLLAPLNITDSPWASIGSAIAVDMKENNGKWRATVKNLAN